MDLFDDFLGTCARNYSVNTLQLHNPKEETR